MMENEINVYDVVKKLIGEIEPVGESHIDEKRYENLVLFCGVIESMISDLYSVAKNKYRAEYSMKKSGLYADNFLDGLK